MPGGGEGVAGDGVDVALRRYR